MYFGAFYLQHFFAQLSGSKHMDRKDNVIKFKQYVQETESSFVIFFSFVN